MDITTMTLAMLLDQGRPPTCATQYHLPLETCVKGTRVTLGIHMVTTWENRWLILSVTV